MEDFNDDFLYNDNKLIFEECDYLNIAHRYIKDSFYKDGDSLSNEFIIKDGKKYSKCRYFLYFMKEYENYPIKIKTNDESFHSYLFKQMLNKAQGLDYDFDFVFDLYDAMIDFIENNEV